MRQTTEIFQWYSGAEEECTAQTKPKRYDRILQQKTAEYVLDIQTIYTS